MSILTSETALIFAEALADIPFFPKESAARGIIASEIQQICGTDERARWLVTRMIRLGYKSWPGCAELRRVYCAKFRPADGIESSGISDSYPEGIPAERAQLEAPPVPLRLSAAQPAQISGDSEMAAEVVSLAVSKSMARHNSSKLPAFCSHCDGRPWLPGSSGALRCVCPRGQWYRAKDTERLRSGGIGVPITKADLDRANREYLDRKSKAAGE